MSAERGDRKPCTRTGCHGTMQFGREPLAPTSARSAADGDTGWVCADRIEHFQLASNRTSATTVVKASVPPR